MGKQITLTLPEDTWAEAKELAERLQVSVEKLLIDQLRSGLNSMSDSDVAIDREKQAWLKLHPMLLKTHYGKHVAVANEQIVDFDDDRWTLMQRINENFPDQFVWVAQVGSKPFRTLRVRSGFIKD